MSLISKLFVGEVVVEIEDASPKPTKSKRVGKTEKILSGHWTLDIFFGLILGLFFTPFVATAFYMLEPYLSPKRLDMTTADSLCAWASVASGAVLFLVSAGRRHWLFALAFALTSVPVSALFFSVVGMAGGGAN